MIALFNFIPYFCPGCGKTLPLRASRIDHAEYYDGVSHSCSCGLSFAYADKNILLDAAKEQGGDLNDYMLKNPKQ